MKLSNLMVDSDLIENGDVVMIAPGENGEPDFKVHVRGYQNADHVRRQAELMASARQKYGYAELVPKEHNEEIDLIILTECILVGWQGLVDDEGKEIAFTPEKAQEILRNPDARQLRRQIEVAAGAMSTQRRKKTEDAEKN